MLSNHRIGNHYIFLYQPQNKMNKLILSLFLAPRLVTSKKVYPYTLWTNNGFGYLQTHY